MIMKIKKKVLVMLFLTCFSGGSSCAMEEESKELSERIVRNLWIGSDIDPMIIEYLSFEDVQYTLPQVCKCWYNIIEALFLKKEARLKEHYNISEIDYQTLKGMSIRYKPDPESDKGIKISKIPAFVSPFGYDFNLSKCGEAGKHVRIQIDYRREKDPQSKDKMEVWIAPKFIVQKDLSTTAAHYEPIMSEWLPEASFGIFYTWWNWYDMNWYSYLVTHAPCELNEKNCFYLLDVHTSPIGGFLNAVNDKTMSLKKKLSVFSFVFPSFQPIS